MAPERPVFCRIRQACSSGKNGDNKAEEKNLTKKAFTVMDGKLVLKLEPAEEGGYTVTVPVLAGLVTEGGHAG